MIIYGEKLSENVFQLKCQCGKLMDKIDTQEYLGLLSGDGLSAIEVFYDCVLCDDCKLNLLCDATLQDRLGIYAISTTQNRVITGLTGNDIIAVERIESLV